MSAFNAQEQAAVTEAAECVVIGDARLYRADCIALMRTLPDNSVDSVVTDPPYGISFMGKAWDGADIVARTERRRGFASHAPDAGPNGGHKSIAAAAGKYDLAPAAMRAFQDFSEDWAREAFRVLKPGGHLLSFSSARTYHRMTSGIEDAGFEIRDQIMWVFGSGFPKSQNVSKALDKAAGAERAVLSEGRAVKRMILGADQDATGSWTKDSGREYVPQVTAPATDDAAQWDGWGTALKPAHEPICVARKPLAKGHTVAANVLAHGTGAINIDACRVEPTGESRARIGEASHGQRYADAGGTDFAATPGVCGGAQDGRWPANLIHDGSAEVAALFPESTSGAMRAGTQRASQDEPGSVCFGTFGGGVVSTDIAASTGSAARFFYCAKASRADRNAGLVDPGPQFKHGATLRKIEDAPKTGNIHPTVKPTDLMAYLCRLVTPPGGVVLDPFMGSGSTGKAAMREGFRFIGVELSAEYFPLCLVRIQHEIDSVAATGVVEPTPQFDLFSEDAS
ncbi:DNA methyltransferase [Janthinobacterium sp. SUN206]|uniref:DNA-methyltransferase n=1 Tax=Janthinobacterium sp. SUN206 TaxID=3014787 RepID=UPI002712EA0E|nr:DNA methyltransferase [Janthinobacterium sp. SUN206]MDO8065584.1 DNA methyltransferase [Janthinobacterium sp. SUN206]